MTLKQKMILSKQLLGTFLKIGAFTFGGGYAMIPLIEKEVVEEKKWIDTEDMLDIIAIAESTPGPIAINSATFVGSKVCGFLGALAATLGVVLPSFLIIVVVSFVLAQFSSLEVIQYAFLGIRAGILALIIKAMYTMYKACPKYKINYIIGIFVFLAVAFFSINVLLAIIASAVVGLVYTQISHRIFAKDAAERDEK